MRKTVVLLSSVAALAMAILLAACGGATATGNTSTSNSASTQAAAALTFLPPPGTFAATQTVTIADANPNVAIYYTTDGSTPTTAAAPYTAPITVSATTTLQAIAVANGSTQIAMTTGTYTIAPPAATPTFSPAPGTFVTRQYVTVTDSTSGAAIYYTTDGSTPTTSSTPYTAPITIDAATTIQAIAVANGLSPSAVATGTYTIAPAAAPPILSPAPGTFSTSQTVTITDSTPGASIFYTINGKQLSLQLYTGPITVSTTTSILAYASASAFSQSAPAGGTYTINPAPPVPPAFSPTPGTFDTVQFVTIADSTPGAGIYYTTDGSTPTTSSAGYLTPIPVRATTTIKAMAVTEYYQGAVATGTYTITSTAPPVLSPRPTTFATTQQVTIANTAPGATIYYTTDGSTPTTSSKVYTGPISIAKTTTIETIAVASGLSPSTVVSGTYAIDPTTKTSDYFYVLSNGNSATSFCEQGIPLASCTIAGFALNPDGSLSALPQPPAPASSISILSGDPLGQYLWAADENEITTYAVNSDGSLTQGTAVSSPTSPILGLFEPPLAIDPKGQSVYAVINTGGDAGCCTVQHYAVGADGTLTWQDMVDNPSDYMVIAPDGSAAFSGWSMGPWGGPAIDSYNRSASGSLTLASSIGVPAGEMQYITALAIAPQGEYVADTAAGTDQSCSGNCPAFDELATYRIGSDKSLTLVGNGIVVQPTNHALFDGTGKWLVLATTSGISVYQVDRTTGALTSTGAAVDASVAFDHLAFSTSGQYLVAVSSATNAMYVYTFQAQTGALTPVGSPYVIAQPSWVTLVHAIQ